jgi:hypothetical protein
VRERRDVQQCCDDYDEQYTQCEGSEVDQRHVALLSVDIALKVTGGRGMLIAKIPISHDKQSNQ